MDYARVVLRKETGMGNWREGCGDQQGELRDDSLSVSRVFSIAPSPDLVAKCRKEMSDYRDYMIWFTIFSTLAEKNGGAEFKRCWPISINRGPDPLGNLPGNAPLLLNSHDFGYGDALTKPFAL